tara:strand:+ start:361 stop:588 length:228 start_codon:yes stop_codon:yes gene_type:complete
MDLEDELFKEAKKEAAEQGRPLRRLVEDALRRYLRPANKEDGGFRLNMPTVKGRPVAGVDVADRDALYERMEDEG